MSRDVDTPKFGGSIDLAWDFHECVEVSMLKSKEAEIKIEQSIKDAGFTFVGSRFHQFETDGEGYSFVAIIGESHVAIHTWPERSALELTIHYCNYTINNDDKAEHLLQILKALFKPQDIVTYDKRVRCTKGLSIDIAPISASGRPI